LNIPVGTNEMRSAEGNATGPDNRLEVRSNVFLSASLDSGTTSVPVRIRNISEHGALLEGSGMPPVGTVVRLTRGALSEEGRLAWQCGGHVGVSFEGDIDVARWVKRVGHGGQERVDGILAALRSSEAIPGNLEHRGKPDSLPAISAALDQLCERLSATPEITPELGDELLRLDWLAQSLRRLATGRSC
jgi:hypothetical protein